MTISPVMFDVHACAREPISIPGCIQPHGALIVLAPETMDIAQISGNAWNLLGMPADQRPDRFSDIAGHKGALFDDLSRWIVGSDALFMQRTEINGRSLEISGHRTKQGLTLEFEEPAVAESKTMDTLYPRLQRFMTDVEGVDLTHLCQAAAREFRSIIGFNRVLIYEFDESWNGRVVAEDGDGVLPSYIGLHFPESDIPAQARALYRLNRLRAIPDANYEPVGLLPALNPTDGAPLDMSFSALRGVSPVHLEYMRNMGTLASMSISILAEGGLWGLISCHHAQPRRVGAQVRAACDFLGQIVSLRIGALEHSKHAQKRLELNQIESDLLSRLAGADDFQAGLGDNPAQWLAMTGAQGAAIVGDGPLVTAGKTPPSERIRALAEWLWSERRGEVFATNALAAEWPDGADISDCASGLLAVSISQIRPSYILWFRQETIRTVTWGGDPRKSEQPEADRLHPRTSFEAWKQLVSQTARRWVAAEVETARDFRRAIVNFVLKRAEERAELTSELLRTNKELESFSYSVSHDLRAPVRHIVGYAELLGARERALDDKSRHYLASIIEAGLSAGRLVDDLLNFSQLGRASILKRRIDMSKLVQEVRRAAELDIQGRAVEWRIGDLPFGWGDASLLRQVLRNLIDNALKYTRNAKPTIITITGEPKASEVIYTIADNGVGFEMAYVGKIFGVFQRLHRSEDFEGTGIGLASTKRIIDRHGGWISAAGAVNRGASFTFALPNWDAETRNV